MSNKLASILNRFSTGTLARETGAYASQISKWKGSRGLPLPRWFPALSKVTGIPVNEISEAVAQDKAARSIAKLNAKGRSANAAQTL